MTLHLCSRRTMLRGLGVGMALPWMESTRVWGDEDGSSVKSSSAPTRAWPFCFPAAAIILASGGRKVREGHGRLGQVTIPLNDFRDRVVFIRGLYNAEALKGNIHSSQTGNLLSGAPLASGGTIRSRTSVDQLLAQTVGHQTKLPQSGAGLRKRANPSVHKNYSMLYSSHISWSSPTTPAPAQFIALAFDQLFKDSAQKVTRACWMRCWKRCSRDFRRDISQLDQRSWMNTRIPCVKSNRIQQAGKRGELQGWRPTLPQTDIPRPKDGYPQDIVEHVRLMSDILVLAFQTDTTRVCTLKLNNDHGTLRFSASGCGLLIHHLLSHNIGRLAEGGISSSWNRWRISLIKLNHAFGKGDRTALDNSMIMLCSSMPDRQPRHHQTSGGDGGRRRRKNQRQPEPPTTKPQPPDVPPVPEHDGQNGRPHPKPSATPPNLCWKCDPQPCR
ncbi:MAG: DUF1552 domain-containing protein [Planctomycetaceae bacterium]